MSLLHGVKKRFILVVVFVLASFLIGFSRNEQASAMIPHKMPRAERSAITKALFGTLYQCLNGGREQNPGSEQYAGCVNSISEAIGSWYLKQQVDSSITFDGGLNSEPDNVTFSEIIEGFKKLIGDDTFNVQKANEILYRKDCLENSITDDCNVIFSEGFDLSSNAEKYKKKYFEGSEGAENMFIVQLRPNLYGLRDYIQKKYNQTNNISEGTNQSSAIDLKEGYSDAEKYWIYWYLMEVAAYHDGGSNEHYIEETTIEAKKGTFKGVKIVDGEAIDESIHYTFHPDITNQDIRYIECAPICSSIDIDPNDTDQDLPEGWTVDYTKAAIEDIRKHKEQIATQQAFLDNNTLNANREQAQEEAATDCKNVYEEAWKQSYSKLVSSNILPDKLFNNPNVGQIIPNLNDTQRKLYYLLSDFESTRIQSNRWQPGTTSTWVTYKSAYGNNVFYTAFGEKEFNLNDRSYLIKPDNSKKLSDNVIVDKEVKQKDGSYKKETTGFCYGYLIHQYIEKSIKQILDEGSIENAADLASIEMGEISESTETQFDYSQSTGYAPEGGGSVNYEPDTCYSGSGSLGWILCPLIWGASNIGEGLWNQIETYHLKLPANALFGVREGQTESGVHSAWRSIRDISNIVFVIVFLVIVISQVTGFGITNYGIKKMLPKLIVCVIIVNLSYILCQIAVDLSNTIGASITDFLRGIAEKIPWSITEEVKSDGGLFSNGFITGALIAGGAGGLFALITSMRTGQNGLGAIIGGLGLFVLGIVIVILVAIITLYITLMIREAAVVVCIAIAPLAIACNVLPNTQPLFKKWLSLMKALLVLYPVSAFMVGGGQLAGAILASTGLNTMRLAAGVVQVLPYFFVPTLLRKSLAGLGNIGAKIGNLGKGLGRKASHGATGLIKNSRRYQDMLAGSKTNAANRYKTSEQARLERKKKRKERHGGQLSEQDVFRLQAAQEYNESRDAKIKAARRSIEADRAAARRRAASSEIAIKDAQLMNGGFGDAANADAFAQAKLNQAITEAKRSTAETAIKYGGAKLNTDGSLTYNESRAAQANRGYIVQGAIQAENSMKDAAAIAKNEAMYTRAKTLEGEVARKDQMDKLAATYGGAEYGNNGQLLKDSDGNYITSVARARDYARGERLNTAIQTRKEAEEKIAEAKHAQSLFRAAAIKGDIDLENKMRTARAFSEDMDENGDFVAPGTGKYPATAYAHNYAVTERNKNNNTLAAGHTAPIPNNFSGAKATHEQNAKNELVKSYGAEFSNMTPSALETRAAEIQSRFDPTVADNGHVQEASALITSLIANKREDQAQNLLNEFTAKCTDVSQVQDLVRNIDAKDVAGIKNYQSAILKSTGVVSYDQFVSGDVSAGGPDMLSLAALAAKKEGGVTTMDSDTISHAANIIAPTGTVPTSATNQQIISGAQALHNVLNVKKQGAQSNMLKIIQSTDPAQFENVSITGEQLTGITSMDQLQNINAMAANDSFKSRIESIVQSITPERKQKMDPDIYKELIRLYGASSSGPTGGSGPDDYSIDTSGFD